MKVPIMCPNCQKRLFDIESSQDNHGTIIIKCNRCKAFASLNINGL